VKRERFLEITRATRVSQFEEVPTIEASATIGLRWAAWAGDTFAAWNPSQGNDSWYRPAQGAWEHWIEFALAILQDDLTRVIRPQIAEVVQRAGEAFERTRPYKDVSRQLTIEELWARFGDPEPVVNRAAIGLGDRYLEVVSDEELLAEIHRRANSAIKP
jgi:hypothetical protein